MSAEDAAVQAKLQDGLRELREVENELSAAVSNRQILDSQLKENEVVLQELQLLKADSNVYKLVGAVLLSQERDEALSNVSKRVEFIKKELKRVEVSLKGAQAKMESKQNELINLQNAFRSNISGRVQ